LTLKHRQVQQQVAKKKAAALVDQSGRREPNAP
jgi:hypothetical protein